jgi:hypothetical protein
MAPVRSRAVAGLGHPCGLEHDVFRRANERSHDDPIDAFRGQTERWRCQATVERGDADAAAIASAADGNM